MTENAEAPAGPDIVPTLTTLVEALDAEDPLQYAEDFGLMPLRDLRRVLDHARRAILYLRDANARLVAENNTLRAELAALRPDGRAR
jgi:hypothetical protein